MKLVFADKKGMEMWQILLLVLSILILLFMLIFYGQLDAKIGDTFDKLFRWL